MADDSKRKLAVPEAKPTSYGRNFVTMAVCEVRFPTLLELETQPPVEIQAALRKDYPFYEPAHDVSFQPGGLGQEAVYTLQSKDHRWQVTLKPSALAVGSKHYSGFDELKERVAKVLHATLKLLDTDFFTRVGLRYQNAIPTSKHGLEGWVNPALIGLLSADVLGDVDRCMQDVRGRTDVGGYTLRHGLIAESKGDYILDLDLYAENVEAKDTAPLVEHMHTLCYSVFHWALGPKALEYLGPGKPK